MMDWIKKALPPIVLIENVFGAPWDKKVELFERIGYSAVYVKLDTKDYYIPHTRQRGYLFAIRRQSTSSTNSENSDKIDSRLEKWKALVGQMKRPASATLDAFVLPNDDPRVLRARARLTAESCMGDGSTRAGRTDWTKCETRHLAARSVEELGDQRPLTGWSESGQTLMPGCCWNEWVGAQVNRIHDVIEINMLRMAVDGADSLWKTMIWNLSQNVDRDTMGRLGLCQCLTPTGVPYLTSRGGPLCGEELLMLQGIPVDDLLLTKESEDNLKDLAGNAMSTTVVGACILAALLVGQASLGDSDDSNSNCIVPSLVPRALVPVSKDISISSKFGKYEQRIMDLSAQTLPDVLTWKAFLADAASSARKCISEGVDECISLDRLVQCRECGQTSSVESAFPPRKLCEHNYVAMDTGGSRAEPSVFQKKLLAVLHMRVTTDGFDSKELDESKDADSSLWNEWVGAVRRTVMDEESGAPSEFLFREVKRTHIWTAYYRNSNGGRLEAKISNHGVNWFLFAKAPNNAGALRTRLENPVARMVVLPSPNGPISLLDGSWEYYFPVTSSVAIAIERTGGLIPSWCSQLGLKGVFECQRQFESLRIHIKDPDHVALKKAIDGTYKLLPKCGGACGSLMKKICEPADSSPDDNDLFFFLDSGLKSLPKDDAFIFTPSFQRTAHDEFREIFLQIDPSAHFRPIVSSDMCDGGDTMEVQAFIPGRWMPAVGASLKSPPCSSKYNDMIITSPWTPLDVPIHHDAWKYCPHLLSCTVKVAHTEDLVVQCRKAGGVLELNLRKSKNMLSSLAFALSRLEIPACFQNNQWLTLDQAQMRIGDQDPVCRKCAPTQPRIRWTLVTKGNMAKFRPIEDGREAAIFERGLKERPEPWIVRFAVNGTGSPLLSWTIGCNAVSIVQRAFGLLPAISFGRDSLVALAQSSDDNHGASSLCEFGWRVVSHVELVAPYFPNLTFSSNRRDSEAKQPPNFLKYKLRKEQLRSLTWMLKQESCTEPFFEEEISESVLPNLNWRIEGRARRPVLVRGGIIADEVGYGKTACALALIDSSTPTETMILQEPSQEGLLPTKATLIVVPKHLMGQWPEEVQKFLCTSKTVLVVQDLSCLNKISVQDVQNADIVIVSFAVLNNDKYFTRLARLTHINPGCVPNVNGGRHFDAVYNEMVCQIQKKLTEITDDCSSAYAAIEKAALLHKRQKATESVRLDGKKAVYKMGVSASKISASGSGAEAALDETDPWKLSCASKCSEMKSPPFEMFSWHRLMVDEFTYLGKKERERCLTVIKKLKSTCRWLLSGTPKHSNFNDIRTLALLFGIHLGVDEDLPKSKISNRYLADKESTGLESLSSFLEQRSMQWHMRRHSVAQSFLNRFVRQNVAELDEIPFKEHWCLVALPPAERAIYLELESHLNSMDMNSKSAQKSKRKSTGDRESRMQNVLQGSETGEEALLKCCSHFNMSSGSRTALETVETIISLRSNEKRKCEQEMISMLTAAFRQRKRILIYQADWLSVTTTEKGEVRDALGVYLKEVATDSSVPHGADEDVNNRVKELTQEAKDRYRADPWTNIRDPFFSDDDERSAQNQCANKPAKRKHSRKKKEPSKEDNAIHIFAMKQSLRNHMHVVRSLSKELCGRYRSLRYIQQIRRYQQEKIGFDCVACKKNHLSVKHVGVLSCCGHSGCANDLRAAAEEGRCIVPLCTARVSLSHVLLAGSFGTGDKQQAATGTFGCKLSEITETVHHLVNIKSDRVVVFCQFGMFYFVWSVV